MAIKLKNYKTKSFLIAGIIVLAATLGFMALYPGFDKKVRESETSAGDTLHSDAFLSRIVESNHILYKDIREKADETNYSYSDLYYDFTQKTVPIRDNTSVQFLSPGEFKLRAENKLIDVFDRQWENDIYEIMQGTDYCVADRVSGKFIKNTGENIEALAGLNEQKTGNSPYVYYIQMSYDGAGNLEKTAVKSTNPDNLLKSIQRVAKTQDWKKDMSYYDEFQGPGIYFLDKGDGETAEMTEVTFKAAPADTTFIYALTREQADRLNSVHSPSYQSNRWEENYQYMKAGVDSTLIIILIAVAIIALLLTYYKKYCLHKLKIMRLSAEAGIVGLVIIFSLAVGGPMVDLVSYSGRGYFDSMYQLNVPWIPVPYYPAVTGALNFIILFIFFGTWYFLVSTFGMVTELGILPFLKEKSILIKAVSWAGRSVKKYYTKFSEELLHADLGKETGKIIRKAVIINFVLLAAICTMWVFGWMALFIYSVVLYFLLKKYMCVIQKQYKGLLKVTASIADGNLSTPMEEDLGVFESYKEELKQIQEGFRKAVDEEVKSQRMKKELITNVSHDLKTPLTAITTYIELLKEENITEKERQEYITVLERKSLRLKFLIEDLFEVSKANSKNVTMDLIDVDICNLMRQVYLEYEDKIEEADLLFRFSLPEEKIMLRLDSQKAYRIFENLYTNIIKYAMPHTRVYIDAEKTEGGICIELKNMSANELNVLPEELTERFVRGDSSRNTEGSGLGLAIAKSFTELMNGKMTVLVDGDLFKVMLIW